MNSEVSFSEQNLPKVAVVILNWNGKNFLEKFLDSVLNSTYKNLDVYVADNASTDDSISYLTEKGFSHYKSDSGSGTISKWIIQLSQNFGFAEGYNRALSQIKNAKYFVLLNSDVEVSPDWIEPVIEQMENDPVIGAAMPKIKMYSDKTLFEYAGAAGGWIDKWGYPFCRGRIFAEIEKDSGQYDDTSEIFWASGAAMFVNANLFIQSEGLDCDFFAHMEEIDFCWKIKRAGYKVMAVPSSVVWHVGGGTLSSESPRKVFLNFRNSLSMLLKNKEGAFGTFFTILIRLFMDGLAGVMFLSKGKIRNVFAIIRAHWSFFIQLNKNIKKRKKIQKQLSDYKFKNNSSFNNFGILSQSIVFKYYINKIKFFRDLKF
jgi:GT2 family glycosyltransferase